MREAFIRLHVEPLEEGGYLATSTDVPELTARGQTIVEATEMAKAEARKLADRCCDHGDSVPAALANPRPGQALDLLLPVDLDGPGSAPRIINRGRGPEIAGTRITVYNILDYSLAGWHHTTIAATLGISSDQVLCAVKYIEEHKDEVMPRYQEGLERAARGNPPEIEARREVSHAKLMAEVERLKKLKKQKANHDEHHGGQ